MVAQSLVLEGSAGWSRKKLSILCNSLATANLFLEKRTEKQLHFYQLVQMSNQGGCDIKSCGLITNQRLSNLYRLHHIISMQFGENNFLRQLNVSQTYRLILDDF